MSTDAATQWLIEDAKRQGLTLSEYERKYGLILSYDGAMPLPSPAEQRIRRNENLAGLVDEADVERLQRAERHVTREREQTRRQSACIVPFPTQRRRARVA